MYLAAVECSILPFFALSPVTGSVRLLRADVMMTGFYRLGGLLDVRQASACRKLATNCEVCRTFLFLIKSRG
jgi:hypothetical protein